MLRGRKAESPGPAAKRFLSSWIVRVSGNPPTASSKDASENICQRSCSTRCMAPLQDPSTRKPRFNSVVRWAFQDRQICPWSGAPRTLWRRCQARARATYVGQASLPGIALQQDSQLRPTSSSKLALCPLVLSLVRAEAFACIRRATPFRPRPTCCRPPAISLQRGTRFEQFSRHVCRPAAPDCRDEVRRGQRIFAASAPACKRGG